MWANSSRCFCTSSHPRRCLGALEVLAISPTSSPSPARTSPTTAVPTAPASIDTLLARGLIADDARFAGRGRPAFLVTTDRVLQVMGVGSLVGFPPRPSAP